MGSVAESLRRKADANDYQYSKERGQAFVAVANELFEEGLTERGQEALWDAGIFFLGARRMDPFEPKERFEVQRQVMQGAPPMNDPVVLDYFERRCGEATHPACRARYADFLFCCNRKRFGHIAQQAYLDLARTLKNTDNHFALFDALGRALQLGLSLHQRTKAQEAASLVVEVAKAYATKGQPRWVLEAGLMLLLDRQAKTDVACTRQMVDLIAPAAESYRTENHALNQLGLRCLISLHKLSGNLTEAQSCRRQVVDALIEHAQREQARSHLVAAHFLTQARSFLADVGGDPAELEDLTKRIEEQTLLGMQELKPLRTSVQLPVEEIRASLTGLNADDTLHRVGALAVFPTTVKELEAEIEKGRELAPLAHLFPRQVIRQGRPAYVSNPQDSHWDDIVQHLIIRWKFYGTCLAVLFKEWFSAGWITPSDVVRVSMSGGLVPNIKQPFLVLGVEAFSRGEYAVALHLLVPHLEDVLRSVYGILGHPTSTMKEGVAAAIPLPVVLEHVDMAALLGDGVVAGMKALLLERSGTNLRHDVAHGLIAPAQCTSDSTATLVWVYLRLGLYRLAHEQSASSLHVNQARQEEL